MLRFTLLLCVLFSSAASARQYIQCADTHSWDRAVVNLDGENSSLFMTNGVHIPDEVRVLKKLFWVEEVGDKVKYATNEGKVIEELLIPQDVIGKYSSYFEIQMTLSYRDNSYARTKNMACFSAIYED